MWKAAAKKKVCSHFLRKANFSNKIYLLGLLYLAHHNVVKTASMKVLKCNSNLLLLS